MLMVLPNLSIEAPPHQCYIACECISMRLYPFHTCIAHKAHTGFAQSGSWKPERRPLQGVASRFGIAVSTVYISELKMVGLLSLPDELLEAVGTQVIGCDKAGLREWCRVTSTCKQLWDMQLPGSASQWSMDLEGDIEGESKAADALLAHSKVPCMCD